MLLSAAAVEAFGAATAKFYAMKGLLVHVPGGGGGGGGDGNATGDGAAADVLAALEARTGLPASAVAETLAAVATAVEGEPDAFGKRTFPAAASYGSAAIGSGGLWVAAVTPALHYSMGGLTFSASAEVLTAASGKPIRRLYAAGEVTGGLFGGNRLGGCSLLDCAVFGRIAGARAAAAAAAAATATTTPAAGAAAAGAPAAPALSPGTLVPLRLSARRFLTSNGASSGRSPSAMMALRFDLPSPLQATGAAVGQYVAAAVPLPDGTTTKRYYSPVSRPADEGVLELLVKSPPPPASGGGGGGSVHVGSASAALGALRPGDVVAFDGPHGGLPFPLDGPGHLAVVVGGTGVSVGVQLVRHVLHTAQARLDAAADGGPLNGGAAGTCAAAVTPGLTLVWAVATPEQLVYRVRMEAQAATDAGRAVPLRLVFVVEAGGEAMVADAPAPATVPAAAAAGNGTLAAVRLGATPAGTPVYAGRVDAALLAAELPTAAAAVGGDGSRAYAVLCGPPPMCKGVRAAVEGMGYRHENVYSWV